MRAFDFAVVTEQVDFIVGHLIKVTEDLTQEAGLGMKFSNPDLFRQSYHEYIMKILDDEERRYLREVFEIVFALAFTLRVERDIRKTDHLVFYDDQNNSKGEKK